MMPQGWIPSLPPMSLQEGSADVWICHLDVSPAQADHIADVLSSEERQKAGRFRFAHDAMHYSVAHGFMRTVLAAYLDVAPQTLQFATGPYGKPLLIQQMGQVDLRFNLSHSQNRAVLALAPAQEVGVDIEAERPLEDIDLIASQFFSPAERAALMALAPQQKQAAFFRCWSRKEAIIKVLGMGLSMPLDDFDVSLAPGDSATLMGMRGEMATQGPWMLYDLPPVEGFATALATAGEITSIHCFSWQSTNDG